MTATMVAVDRGEVWADDSGGDGPPLVLLHPATGDSRIWDPVLPALTPKYRVIRYDTRGFGQSPAPAVKFSLLRDLISVLDHYGLDRVPVVGCSQGGGSALGLILDQPERVPAIVLLCTGVPGFEYPESASEESEELDDKWDRAVAGSDVNALVSVMERAWRIQANGPGALEQLRSAARAVIANGSLQEEDPAVFDRLGAITVPVAVLVGDADYPPTIEANKQVAARIPGCEFTLVPGMDHLPPLREPGLIAAAIMSTLARAAW
ncbi:MAG: alpha/beta fold hydrolase [Trebonia sp.]